MAIDLDGQDGLDGANVNANETPGNPYVFESAGSPSSIADGAINAKLNPANVRVQTGAGTGANGDIIFGGATAIVFDAGATSNNLSFAAHGSVFVNQATSCTNGSGHAPLLQRYLVRDAKGKKQEGRIMSDIAFTDTGSAGAEYRLRLNGAQLELLRNGVVVESQALASVNAVTINGGTGDDTLLIDQLISLPGGVSFNGGLPVGLPGDAIVMAVDADSVSYSYTNATDGRIVFASGGTTSVYNFTGIDPLDMTGTTVGNLVLNLPGGGDDAVLEDNGAFAQVRSINGSFETTAFSPPSNSLTINGGSGDEVTLNTTKLGGTALVVNGPSAVEVLNLGATPLSSILFDANLILVNALVSATGAITIAGGTNGVSLAANVNTASTLDLSASGSGISQAAGAITASLLTSSGGVTGHVILTSAANAIATVGPFAVTSGDFRLTDSVANLTIAGPVSASGDVQIVNGGGAITQTAGATIAAANGAISLDGTQISLAANLITDNLGNASTVTLTGPVVLTATGVTIDTDQTAGGNAGNVTFTSTVDGTSPATNTLIVDARETGAGPGAGGAITFGGAVGSSAGTRLAGLAVAGSGVTFTGTNNVDTLAIALSGAGLGVSFTDADSLDIGTVGGVTGITTNGGAVTLTATTGAITRTAGTVAGALVTMNAATGIGSAGGAGAIDTAVDVLGATNTTSGNIVIVEADLVSLAGITNSASGGNVSVSTTNGLITTSGTISANGGAVTLTAGGAGSTLTVNNAVSTTGAVTLNSSSLTTLGVALGGIGSLTTDAGGTTAINGGSVTTTGAQTYHDAVTLGSATNLTGTAVAFDSTVNNNGNGLTVTNSGAGLFSGAISGGGGFTKAGGGTTTLAAANTYGGATAINAGTLLVNGSIANSAVTVNAGTLGGNGTVGAVTVASGGTLSPGASAGMLTTGDVSLTSGAILKIELNGTTIGSGYDQLKVNGTVTLGGATLDALLGFDPTTSGASTFTIIDNDGTADTVTGTFAGLAEGSHFNIAGHFFTISYTGGDGNDVVLSTANDVIDEPRRDFNGDGKADILWQNADGTPAVWLMDGHSLIAGANVGPFNPGPAWKVIDAGDFDGDGRSDILWQNNDGTVAQWSMDGTTLASGGSVAFNPGPSWHAIAAGDFNGDSKSDILWQNDDGAAAVWLMDGTTILTGTNVGPDVGPTWKVQTAADFNGDGKADILWQNDNGAAAIWLMDGTTLLSGANVGPINPGPSWLVAGAGDFNGDGNADILWQNLDGSPAIWLMDGLNFIAGQNVGFNPGQSWEVKGADDFDGDGKADILWQSDNGTPAVWLMDGFNLVSGADVGPFNPGQAWHVVDQIHLV